MPWQEKAASHLSQSVAVLCLKTYCSSMGGAGGTHAFSLCRGDVSAAADLSFHQRCAGAAACPQHCPGSPLRAGLPPRCQALLRAAGAASVPGAAGPCWGRARPPPSALTTLCLRLHAFPSPLGSRTATRRPASGPWRRPSAAGGSRSVWPRCRPCPAPTPSPRGPCGRPPAPRSHLR